MSRCSSDKGASGYPDVLPCQKRMRSAVSFDFKAVFLLSAGEKNFCLLPSCPVTAAAQSNLNVST